MLRFIRSPKPFDLNLNLEVNFDRPISVVSPLRPGSPITVYDCLQPQHI